MDIRFTVDRPDVAGSPQFEAAPDLVERRLYADDEHAPTRWLTLVEGSGPFSLKEEHGDFRADRGLFVTAQRHADGATEAALAEVEAWYRAEHIPDLLAVRGVTGCRWYESEEGRDVRLYGIDVDLLAFHEDLAARTPGMSMIDLRPAYRSLLVSSYRTCASEL
jgi:hypothetical protein